MRQYHDEQFVKSLTGLPREPCAGLNLMKIGVFLVESVRTGANVNFEALSS